MCTPTVMYGLKNFLVAYVLICSHFKVAPLSVKWIHVVFHFTMHFNIRNGD